MKTIGIISLVLLMLSGAWARQDVGSVEFAVVNRWGSARKFKVLHFRNGDRSLDLASSFRNLSISKIPYGIYTYELVPETGETVNEKFSGEIEVFRDQIHITRVLETTGRIGRIGQFPVWGTLEHMPKGIGPIWITVQNAYGKYQEESVVNEKGEFQFYFIWGTNVLTVCAGSEILMSGLVKAGLNDIITDLKVNLKTGKIETAEKPYPLRTRRP
jgi:hypothetical protein